MTASLANEPGVPLSAAEMRRGAALEMRDLLKAYPIPGGEPVSVLKGINLVVPEGDFIAIMGPSGSGKSTLLNILGCLDRPTGGAFLLGGQDVATLSDDELSVIRAKRLGFVFQSYNLIPQLTVLENIETPLFYGGQLNPVTQAQCRRLAERVNLGERLDHRPMQLSGGQQQRAGIARSLINEPQYILADEPTGNLDTVTTQEILTLMDQLNESGKTIVLVTHEEEVAARARRIVRLRDGLIVSDTRYRPPALVEPSLHGAGQSEAHADGRPSSGSNTRTQRLVSNLSPDAARLLPQITRTFSAGIKSLALHPLRSFLTVLGIFIGVAAVIWLLAIGEGISAQAQKQIAALGANNLIIASVAPPATTSSRRQPPYGTSQRDLERLQAALPGMVAAVPIREQQRRDMAYQGRRIYGRLLGTTPEHAQIAHLQLQRGRFISKGDMDTLAKVCVVTPDIVRELFKAEDPLGKRLKIYQDYYEIVGILKQAGSGMVANASSGGSAAVDATRDAMVPLATLIATNRDPYARDSDGIPLYTQLTLSLRSANEVIDSAQVVRTTLKKYHPQDDWALTVPLELLEQARHTRLLFISFMGLIAAISLLVGGIGIMNIMLATVTERTREIGIRRALGARQRDIMRQFLIETAVLSAVGGLTGVLFGLLCPASFSVLLWGLEKFLPMSFAALPETVRTMSPVIVGWSLPLAAGIAVLIGMVFGLYPAKRAAAMDPIQALRHVA